MCPAGEIAADDGDRDMTAAPIPLHSGYQPLAEPEIDMVERALASLHAEHPRGAPSKEVIAELVRLGIPTTERAEVAPCFRCSRSSMTS
jgi:hypothetical protein